MNQKVFQFSLDGSMIMFCSFVEFYSPKLLQRSYWQVEGSKPAGSSVAAALVYEYILDSFWHGEIIIWKINPP